MLIVAMYYQVIHHRVACVEVEIRVAVQALPIRVPTSPGAVPGGSKWERLHSYANLDFHARNPMMYYLVRHSHNDLAVIRVSEAVFLSYQIRF